MKIPKVWSRKNRILLKELVKTDFKLRYQGSVLGYLWAILRPMMLFAILYIVFAKFLNIGGDIPHYSIYLMIGTVFWSFFVECTNQGIQSIVSRGDLIRKISFPKWVIVVSSTITALINFFINLGVIIILALINGVTPSFSWILVIPLILEIYILSLGISFLLTTINVKFRDISSIWEVLIQALFYAVPIIYPISMVANTNMYAAKILLLNPIAQIIQDVRYYLVTSESVTTWSMISDNLIKFIPIIIVILSIVLGSLYFKKRSKYFAEEV